MLYTKPYFFDNFKCKADKCTDTCCAGWEVDVDSDSYEKYMSAQCNLKDKLRNNIVCEDGQYCFRLTPDERCVFLDCNGLCEIYSQLGEDYLCDICREHPRFYDFFDGVTESGLGLCCEKVCEMIFASDAPITFETYSDECDDEMYDDDIFYFQIRQKCFDIICDRTERLSKRIVTLLDFIAKVQNNINTDVRYSIQMINRNKLFSSVIDLFIKTEAINNEWTEYINYLSENKDKFFSVAEKIPADDVRYEQILTYLLYRHFMQSRYEGNVSDYVCFCVASLIFIYIADCKTYVESGCINMTDRINNVKFWSKQIEYSTDNINIVTEEITGLFFEQRVFNV